MELAEHHGRRVRRLKTNRYGISTLAIELGSRLGFVKPKARGFEVETQRSEHSSDVRSPEARTKSVGRLTQIRRVLTYVIDAVILRILVMRERTTADVLVCDRYLYDALARIALTHPRSVRFIRRLMYRPDCAFVVTAEPAASAERRPGSSVAYFEQKLRQFDRLESLCPELIRIEPGDIASCTNQILSHAGVLIGVSRMSPEHQDEQQDDPTDR